jgi:serine/threonine-protein kinase PknK
VIRRRDRKQGAPGGSTATEDSPAPPSIFGYRDLVVIGRGATATVYRAVQDGFDRQVAVKVLNVDISDRRAQKRFQRERSLNGRLSNHPNVVTVLDSGFVDGRYPYLAMEFLENGSLADQLRQRGPFDVADALHIGVRIAGALETAHRLGVLHRDVKPHNILSSRFGEPALADFGIAAILEMEHSLTNALTPVHAAPEVLEGADATARTDVYALGSTLYTLLAGTAPFAGPPGEGMLAQLLRITTSDLPVLARGDVPELLVDALRTATAKRPEARFTTSAEFGEALRDVQRAMGGSVTWLPIDTAVVAAAKDAADAERAVPAGVDDPTPTPTPRQLAEPTPASGLALGVADSTAGSARTDEQSVPSPAPAATSTPTPAAPLPPPTRPVTPPPPPAVPAATSDEPLHTVTVAPAEPELVRAAATTSAPAVVARDDEALTVSARQLHPLKPVVEKRRRRWVAPVAVVAALGAGVTVGVLLTGGDDDANVTGPPPSNTVALGTQTTVFDKTPFVPTGVTITPKGDVLEISWTDNTGGQSEHLIRYGVADEPAPTTSPVAKKGASSLLLTGVAATAPICVKVVAVLGYVNDVLELAESQHQCANGGTLDNTATATTQAAATTVAPSTTGG